MCITLLFLLPSEQLDLNSKQSLAAGVLPYQDANDKLPLGPLMRQNYINDGPEPLAAANENDNLFPYAHSEKEVSCLISFYCFCICLLIAIDK